MAQATLGKKNNPGCVPLSGSAPKLNGLYSGLRLILHLSFVEIHLVVFVYSCLQTNQKMQKSSNKPLPGLLVEWLYVCIMLQTWFSFLIKGIEKFLVVIGCKSNLTFFGTFPSFKTRHSEKSPATHLSTSYTSYMCFCPLRATESSCKSYSETCSSSWACFF